MSPHVAAAPVIQQQARPITVLCVDNAPTALQSVLESQGYRVLVVKSGAQGIDMFNSQAVDAVVLDYWMNDMSGLQVARQMRQLNRTVPIIILSAYIELLDESVGLVDVWIRKGEHHPKYLLERLAGLVVRPSAYAHP